MTVELILFYLLAGLAVSGSLALVAARSTVSGVLALGVAFTSLVGIYVLLEAHFVAAVQLIVGISSLLALFLFAVSLEDAERTAAAPRDPGRVVIKVLGLLMAVAVGAVLVRVVVWSGPTMGALPTGFGGFREVGLQLFTRYLAPLQALGLLLLASLIGAALLLRRESD